MVVLVGCSLATAVHVAMLRGRGHEVLILSVRPFHSAQGQSRIAIFNQEGHIYEPILTTEVVGVDSRVKARTLLVLRLEV